MLSEQLAKWKNPSRKPFHLFSSVEEELSVRNDFWLGRTPLERLEYLEFMRCVIYGEDVVNAKTIRCYGWRKRNETNDAPSNIIYF